MSNLEPGTLRLHPEEWEELDEEANDRGWENLSDYLRFIIRNRDSIEENTSERLDKMEERLNEIEQELELKEKYG